MSNLTWSQLGELFHAALATPVSERAAFLDAACGGDDAARREIEAMLDAHEGSSRLHVEDRLLSGGDPVDPLLGRTIGAYRLVSLIGRGGMGDVYLAERDDAQYERRVAFKLIRPGLARRGATERFLRERQILAQLEHPNIAMLLDGGMTDDGHPYLVMQYVDGEPITEWVRRRKLPLRARLELFCTVCETVQAAHNNLVVHRDLKPANILVTEGGEIRLLDFGIAKLLDETDTDTTMALDRLLTPAHAAPEQVMGRPVTTATDVYSLGVLLYELLTDERPLDVDQSSATAIERSICEAVPEPPSRRRPERRRALRGELDTIVLTALRKEPGRRYQSARELGEDVANHLHGRPVRAQGDSLLYRTRKTLARHRLAVTAAAAFLAMVAVSMGVVTQQSRQRLVERDRALAEQARADAVIGVLSDLLTGSNPLNHPEGEALTQDSFIGMLAGAVDGLDDQPQVQARLRELLASVYAAHGRNQEWLAAMAALVAYHEQAGSDSLTLARVRHNRALATVAVHGAETAVPLLQESLARHRALLGPVHRDVGVAATDLARNLALDDPEAAADLMQEALAIAEVHSDVDSLAMARVFNGLGNLAMTHGDADVARGHYETCLELLEPFLGEANPNTMTVQFNLARTLRRPDQRARAESVLRRNIERRQQVLGRRNLHVAYSWEALGGVLVMQGRPEEALAAFASALDIQREASGEHAAPTSYVLVKIGSVLTVMGRPAEAVDRFAEVRAMEAARMAEGQSPDTLLEAFGHALEALARHEAGDRRGALAVLDEVTPVLETTVPRGRSWIPAEVATVQATLLLAEGQAAPALAAARRALADRLTYQGDLPTMVGRNQALVAAALAATGQEDQARALLAEFGDAALACGYLTPLQRRLVLTARDDLGP
ncbi:protein kinase [bacterium]|nr:protein kinase [bacterium]